MKKYSLGAFSRVWSEFRSYFLFLGKMWWGKSEAYVDFPSVIFFKKNAKAQFPAKTLSNYCKTGK